MGVARVRMVRRASVAVLAACAAACLCRHGADAKITYGAPPRRPSWLPSGSPSSTAPQSPARSSVDTAPSQSVPAAAAPPQLAARSDRVYTSQEYSREVSEFVASIETTLTSGPKRRADTSAETAKTEESAEADAHQRTYGQGRLRGGQQLAPSELTTPDVSTILNKIETLNNLSKAPEPSEEPAPLEAAAPTYIPPTYSQQLPTSPPATAYAFSPDLTPAAVQPLETTHEPHAPDMSLADAPLMPYDEAQGDAGDADDGADMSAMPVFEHVQMAVKHDPEYRARFIALLGAIESTAGEVSLNSVVCPQTLHRIASSSNLQGAASAPNLN